MGPNDETVRSRFLHQLFADEETGALRPLDQYLHEFPSIDEFVRHEHAASQQRAATAPHGKARYVAGEVLAHGGMGEVRLATDTALGRQVVLKTLRAPAFDPRAAERLRREARVLGRLDHPALCRILDVFEADGATTLVLPFLQGETLAVRIERSRQATPGSGCVELSSSGTGRAQRGAIPQLLLWLATVADAVHAAHQAGVVHRDLKPANLLVQPGGEPMVLDFGLALEAGEEDQRLTRTGEQVGTPLYMAPEQVEGGACDARTDVYALGVVLYEMLTLQRPFAAPSREATFRRILDGRVVAPRRHVRAVPKDLEAVCLKAMERDPARRYASAAAFAAELRRVVRLEATEARPVTAVGAVVRMARRYPLQVAGAGVTLGLVAATVLALDFWRSYAAEHSQLGVERSRMMAAAWQESFAREFQMARRAMASLPPASRSQLGFPDQEKVDMALLRNPTAIAKDHRLAEPPGLPKDVYVRAVFVNSMASHPEYQDAVVATAAQMEKGWNEWMRDGLDRLMSGIEWSPEKPPHNSQEREQVLLNQQHVLPFHSAAGCASLRRVAHDLRNDYWHTGSAERIVEQCLSALEEMPEFAAADRHLIAISNLGITGYLRPMAGGRDDLMALLLDERGMIRLLDGRFEEALGDFRAAGKHAAASGMHHLVADTHLDAGEALVCMGRNAEAWFDLALAYEFYGMRLCFQDYPGYPQKLATNPDGQRDVVAMLGQIALAQGRIDDAIACFDSYLVQWAATRGVVPEDLELDPLVLLDFDHRALNFAECLLRRGGPGDFDAARNFIAKREVHADQVLNGGLWRHLRYVQLLERWLLAGDAAERATVAREVEELRALLPGDRERYYDMTWLLRECSR